MACFNKKNIRIDPFIYQHPADKAAATAVMSASAFEKALEFIGKNGIERELHAVYRSSYAMVTPSVSPIIHDMIGEAKEMFSVEKTPDVFLQRSYDMNITLTGADRPIVVISSEFLRNLDELGLWGVIACEIGAIKAGYGQIKLVEWLCGVAGSVLPVGIALALQTLLKNWHRYAQYSVDRSTLIAMGDFNAAMRIILCGETPNHILGRINFADPNNQYFLQCQEFLEGSDTVVNTIRGVEAITGGKCYYASRYMELFKFYQNEYQDIMDEYTY